MIGLIGGTFDPIHLGHLRIALEVAERCQLDQLRFIPGHTPPHRAQPLASPEQRWEMVQRAIAPEPRFVGDRRELERAGASYTVDTLTSLRRELGADVPLLFIMGADAFLGFQRWQRWQTILELTHLVVTQRPGYAVDEADWYRPRLAACVAELRAECAGRVLFTEVTQLDISATFIRERGRAGGSLRYLLPEVVCDYIADVGLYGPGRLAGS